MKTTIILGVIIVSLWAGYHLGYHLRKPVVTITYQEFNEMLKDKNYDVVRMSYEKGFEHGKSEQYLLDTGQTSTTTLFFH